MYRAPVLAQPVQPPRRRRVPWRALRVTVIAGVWLILLGAALVLWFARDLPQPGDALASVRRPSLVLQNRRAR